MNIDAYNTDNIIIIEPTFDKYGDEVSTTETTIRGRVNKTNKIVRDFKGKEVIASAEVLLNYQTITNNARIKYDSIEHILLSIITEKDFANKYLRLYVQ